jgi:hypothetical protein
MGPGLRRDDTGFGASGTPFKRQHELDKPGIVPDFYYQLCPIFHALKLLIFLPRVFRRAACDETILPPAKPFSAFGADIWKRRLTTTPPNETPNGELGACHAERHCHQRCSKEAHHGCAHDIG